VSSNLLLLLTPLRQALERIERKALPLLATPSLLDNEEGQDLLDIICMQFLAAGEALKRLEKLVSLPRFQGQCLESCFYTDPMKTNDHNECLVYATPLQR